MIPLALRRPLQRLGLLEPLRAAKQRVVGRPDWSNFKPADPRTLVSSMLCFRWLEDRHVLAGTDYLEFGIFRGFNLWFVQAMARASRMPDMRFVGFDSFFGMPPAAPGEEAGPFVEGSFSAYREEVTEYFNRYDTDWNRVIFVEGFFDRTLNAETVARHQLRRCAFAVVDCDLYSSTVPVLAFVEPLLTDVAVLLFDDWQDYGGGADDGEPRAFREFMERHADRYEAEPFEDLLARGGKGQAFILRRRTAARNGTGA